MPQENDNVVLKGAGWHKWKAWKDGDDILATGLGTVFGGGEDSEDNSEGYWGDKIGPNTLAVSLPTGRVLATQGSPFPEFPGATPVQIHLPETGKSVTAPLLDEGPTYNDEADTGIPGSAMVDLSVATARALGMGPDDSLNVEIRIVGGAAFLKPENYETPPPDPNNIEPGDAPILARIKQMLPTITGPNGGPPYDVDEIRSLLMELKSGALYELIRQFDGYLDNAENTENSNPARSRTQFGLAANTFVRMEKLYVSTR